MQKYFSVFKNMIKNRFLLFLVAVFCFFADFYEEFGSCFGVKYCFG